jgi:hypothetical protein
VKPLQFLPNQVSRLSAQAVKALTHHGRFFVFVVSGQNAPAKHPKSFIGNPPSFTTRGSNPDSGFSFFMHDSQSPFSLQAQNVTVGNQSYRDWIHNKYTLCVEHHFWSNPKKVTDASKQTADNYFDDSLGAKSQHQNTIRHEQGQQNKRDACPDEIASGPKSIVHPSIIAGETK